MARSGAVTFKGNAMTLLGEELGTGAAAPDFALHFFEGGLNTITKADLAGKPSILSVVCECIASVHGRYGERYITL